MSRTRIAVPIAWMGVLWFLSSLPSGHEGSLAGFAIPSLIQNSAHAVVYAILAAIWFWALGTETAGIAGIVAVLSLGYAVIDELHQAFVPGRTSSLLDLCIDALGVAVVIWIVRNRPVHSVAALR